MTSLLERNDIEVYSTDDKGKSVTSERFIRKLENTNYKYITPISKSMYIDKLDDTVNKYN